MEKRIEVFQTRRCDLPYDPTTTFLDIYLREMKLAYQRNTCTSMFIASLFTITKIWNQPLCQPTDEWIKNVGWKIMEYAIRKNDILSFAAK
jgi:hypothetical protein